VRRSARAAAVETMRAASTIPVDLHLAVWPELTTRCSASELEHLVFGLALDAVAELVGDTAPPIELFVRERTIEGKPWLEIVRGARPEREAASEAAPDAVADTVDPLSEHFDLRAVEAIAIKNGGELARSERRGGGIEVIVALPLIVG
jgi:hypothetical protein